MLAADLAVRQLALRISLHRGLWRVRSARMPGLVWCYRDLSDAIAAALGDK